MRNLGIIGVLLAALLSAGCMRTEPVEAEILSAGNTVAVESLHIDNYFVKGKTVQIFNDVPKRVVVVGDRLTETLLDLDVEAERIIHVEQSRPQSGMKEEHVKTLKEVTKIPWGGLNVENILQLQPDVIIAQQSVFMRNRLNNTDYWNRRGIKTLVHLNTSAPSHHVYKETVRNEMQFIEDLGKVFRREEKAKAIIADACAAIRQVKEETQDVEKPEVMTIEFLSSMISYDRTKLAGDMAASVGGRVNVTPPVIGFEDIVKENPDVLFIGCSHSDYGTCVDWVRKNKGLRNLPCVNNGRVYAVPLRFIYGSSSRTKEGIEWLAERMYGRSFDWQSAAL